MARRQSPLQQADIEHGFEVLGIATEQDRARFQPIQSAPLPAPSRIYVTRLSNTSAARGVEEKRRAGLERDSQRDQRAGQHP
jgi:hypothetical protein